MEKYHFDQHIRVLLSHWTGKSMTTHDFNWTKDWPFLCKDLAFFVFFSGKDFGLALLSVNFIGSWSYVKMIVGTQIMGFWDSRNFRCRSQNRSSNFRTDKRNIALSKGFQNLFHETRDRKDPPKLFRSHQKRQKCCYKSVFDYSFSFHFTCLKCKEKAYSQLFYVFQEKKPTFF